MLKYKPFIPDRVGYELHRFGLEYLEGWVFFRILKFFDNEYLDFTRNFDEIDDGESTGSTKFEDATETKFLEIPESEAERFVNHVGIGFNPELWCYPEFPSGRKLAEVLGTDMVKTGDARGMVRGKDSPIGEPTEKMEFVMPFGMKLMVDYYNPGIDGSPAPIQPVNHIQIRTYKMEPLNPSDPDDAALISAMARGLVMMSPRAMGGLKNLESYSALKRQWEVEEIETLRDARKLATAGGAKEAAYVARKEARKVA